ncbi:MAG TPA: hypothetical protein VFT29_02890 [Gemmatimonadaceae bacterium]|nr:hypothetical protein [Gemmatimonadaceae bacterium]
MSTGSEDAEPRVDAERLAIVREVEGDGEIWIVREVPAPQFDRRGGTHLVFESAFVMRRLRTFPKDWISMSAASLYQLSLDMRDASEG